VGNRFAGNPRFDGVPSRLSRSAGEERRDERAPCRSLVPATHYFEVEQAQPSPQRHLLAHSHVAPQVQPDALTHAHTPLSHRHSFWSCLVPNRGSRLRDRGCERTRPARSLRRSPYRRFSARRSAKIRGGLRRAARWPWARAQVRGTRRRACPKHALRRKSMKPSTVMFGAAAECIFQLAKIWTRAGTPSERPVIAFVAAAIDDAFAVVATRFRVLLWSIDEASRLRRGLSALIGVRKRPAITVAGRAARAGQAD
jgi:hypothetical protein